jgi:small subunit ribosomal protein S21
MGGPMPEILLNETDRIDWALKMFKRQMQKAGILRELRRRRHYVKPSAARQIKSKAAQRQRDQAARKARARSRSAG